MSGGPSGSATGPPRLLERFAGVGPRGVFVFLALTFGLWNVLVTPPLQVPDEQVHLFRSYQISRLDLFKPRDQVPEDLVKFLWRFERLMTHPENKTSLAELRAELSRGVDAARTRPHFTSDLVLAYAPQAAGVAIVRLAGGSPLAMMYLGRLFNLLVYVLLVATAIRVAPVFKWTLLVVALMPMSVHLAASLSYDPPTIGLAFLFTALVLRCARAGETPLSRASLMPLFLAAWGLALVKQPYVLLTGAFLLVPVARLGPRRRYLLVFAALVGSSLLVSQAWSAVRLALCAAGLLDCPPAPGGPTPAELQLLSMLHAPMEYARTYLATLRRFWQYWIATMIGSSLGWLDTALPAWVVQLNCLLLPAVALTDTDGSLRPGLVRRVLLAGLFLSFLLLIPTLLYVFDPRINPRGAAVILGVQGRYFIPVVPIALLAISTRVPPAANLALRGIQRMAILAAVVSSLIAAAATLFQRFYRA